MEEIAVLIIQISIIATLSIFSIFMLIHLSYYIIYLDILISKNMKKILFRLLAIITLINVAAISVEIIYVIIFNLI